jgi:hypothetical protein
MFSESVERLIDHAGTWGVTVNNGEVAFLNFTALLHFTEEGSVFFAPSHQEKAARFAVESANKRKKLIWVLVAKPVDERESSIGAGRVDEPTGWFVDDQEKGVFQDNRGIHQRRLVQRDDRVEV